MSSKMTVGDQLGEILDEYEEEVKETALKAIKQVAQETAKDLRNTSPKRTGEYARGWRSKSDGEDGYVVYNSTAPQLTHLLENGHAKVKGGRVAAREHIEPAQERAEQELMTKIERML